MSGDLIPALALAERYRIALDLVDGDRLHWRSHGPTPDAALAALKAAKGALVNLLVRYRLNSAGDLAGDDLLAALRVEGFAVRRYGVNAALDDAFRSALDRVPPMTLLYAFADKQVEYGLALRALRAPDCLEGRAYAPREELFDLRHVTRDEQKSICRYGGQRIAGPSARPWLPG
jgi:hypothetical protein